MEPSYQTKKIIERFLLWALLAVLAVAAVAQFTSPLARALAQRRAQDVRLTVLTAPAMDFTYNPASQKAVVQISAEKVNARNRAKKFPPNKGRYFIPREADREAYWDEFKRLLSSWRYNPLLVLRPVWAYVTAWHDRRTNLTPAEFALLSLELSKLDAADFAVRFPAASRRKKAPAAEPKETIEDMAPLAVKDRPIVVEIYNAAGKRGLALALTQYLREQNEKGLLRVDVLQYDNYPSYQEQSFIVDYSGRLVQVKQLSHALGINSEIKSESSPNAICDTRIVLGKDFEMPL